MRMLTKYVQIGNDGANGQALEQLVREFEEQNPGIDIEPVFVPGSELLTKLRTALVNGGQPATNLGGEQTFMQISDTVAKAVVEALYGRATPAKALDDAAKQVQQLLK